jgi:hypothetical protein
MLGSCIQLQNLIVERIGMKKAALVISLAGIIIAACTSVESVALAPHSMLSAEIMQAPDGVQDAYRFALANQDILSQIPCYCGCGGVGHTSNLDCYVADIAQDGSISFDYHALG